LGDILETKVLIVSHDVVGPSMAGSGMRYWFLAQALASEFSVILVCPLGSDKLAEGKADFRVYDSGDWSSVAGLFDWADVAVIGSDILQYFPHLVDWSKPLVVDGYDPHSVETLALWSQSASAEEQIEHHLPRLRLLARQACAADFLLCASETQRTWWLGILEALGRVNPYTYGSDPSLRQLVDVVPFGLSKEPFPVDRESVKLPNVQPDDQVLLWGGGLWEWLDPLTVIRAMPAVLESHPKAKLLFPGTRHPNSGMPEMQKVAAARALSCSLGLGNRCLFSEGWVPRSRWVDYLARADVGISAHMDTLESRLAFRSRILDYIWACLPMVVTQGDETSDLVVDYDMGLAVLPGDSAGFASAIVMLLNRPRGWASEGFAQAQQRFTWDRAASRLVDYCRKPTRAPDKRDRAYRDRYLMLGVGPLGSYDEVGMLRQDRDQLRAQLEAYESGRFIRLMRWLSKIWHGIRRSSGSGKCP